MMLLFLRLKTIAFLVPFFSMVINAIALTGTGGGVQGQIFKMDICCSPGYGEPGTFYGIKKFCSSAEI